MEWIMLSVLVKVVHHAGALSTMMEFLHVFRCRSKGDGAGSADSGSGCTWSGCMHGGEAVCGSHVGFSHSCNGRLDYADPWGPAGPGVPWRCREPAETSAGKILCAVFTNVVLVPFNQIFFLIIKSYLLWYPETVNTHTGWGFLNLLISAFHCLLFILYSLSCSLSHMYSLSSLKRIWKVAHCPILAQLDPVNQVVVYYLLCILRPDIGNAATFAPDLLWHLWEINILLGICIWQWHKLRNMNSCAQGMISILDSSP